MRQNLRSGFRGRSTENLLDSPEARVVEPFRERHDIRRRHVFVFLRPCTARQFIRLNGREDGKVQERDLVRQLLGGDAQGTANHRVQVVDRSVRRETVGFLRRTDAEEKIKIELRNS